MADWRDQTKKEMKEISQKKKTFRLVEGDNVVRILPNVKGTDKPPYVRFNVHPGVGPNNRFVRCGREVDSGEGECWLCDTLIPKLESSGKKSQRAIAENMASRPNFVVQVAWVDPDSDEMRGPKFWYVPTGKAGGQKAYYFKIMSLLSRTAKKYDDPKKGFNFTVNRTGEGRATTYQAPDPDEDSTPVPSSILKKLRPLSEVVPEYSEQTQKNAYHGREDDEEEEDVEEDTEEAVDDEEEKPKSKKKRPADDDDEEEKPKKKSKKAKDEDDEAEDEEESEDEEEEEETPKKKSKKKSADEDDEEEEKPKRKTKKKVKDDDETEDEEEEETPKKKSKKKAEEEEEDEAEEEDDEEADEDEEEEEEEKPKRKAKKKAKKPADDDEEEDEEEDED